MNIYQFFPMSSRPLGRFGEEEGAGEHENMVDSPYLNFSGTSGMVSVLNVSSGFKSVVVVAGSFGAST